MILRKVVVLALVAALAVSPCGCGAAAGGADARVRLPAAFPPDVPLPEGAFLRAARDLGSKGITLVFETPEPVAAVEGRLRERLEAGGWVLLSEVLVDGAAFSSYRRRERSVALGISRTGAVTVVGLAYLRPETEAGGAPG